MNRRMSTSFLQTVLIKQQSEHDSVGTPGQEETDDVTAKVVSPSPMPLSPPTQEQCASLVQLMQYVHSLVVSSTG